MPRALLASLLLALLCVREANAQGGPRPRARAVRIAAEATPRIDGKIDEAIWAAVPISEAFTQKFPLEGKPPAEKTRLRIAYDDQALYVAIECEQRLAPVVRRLTRRDRSVESDWVSVGVDTRRDGKSGFEFTVNAAGVLTDSIRFDDTGVSTDWDENWEAETALVEGGWSAELRIPLRILRFTSLPVQSWGFQVRRYVSHRQETDEWAFIPRSAAGEVSQYGRLDDLRALAPSAGIELSPFVWGRWRRRDGDEGRVASGTDWAAAGGLDFKWHPSQQLTLDAAFLPDFSQVEADQVVLNLTNFETNYPEKRRFFLEGTDTFHTSEVQLLYTRRIGRAAPAPALRPGERLVDLPEPASILGALKLTGHLGDVWTIGALSAVTARHDVEVERADGIRARRVVDPLSVFNVLRVKRALGDNGHLGLTATSVLRAERTADSPVVEDPVRGPFTLCADGREVTPGRRCSNDAHAGSLDWRWRSPSGDYLAQVQLTGSVLDGGPPRLIPDGTVIAAGDLGTSVRAVFNKEGGKNWLWNTWVARDSARFDVNDVGYLDRANQIGAGLELIYRNLEPWGPTLESSIDLDATYLDNIAGVATDRSAAIESWTRLRNFWSLSADLTAKGTYFDDREVGDGTALERARNLGLSLEVETDPRARVVASLYAGGAVFPGGRSLQAELTLLFRMLPQLDLELNPQVLHTRGETRYAGTSADGDHIFGRLLARSAGVVMRATYTFTPRLTLQSYAQLFLSARHYDDLAAFTPMAPRPVVRLADLRPTTSVPTSGPDTQDGALNINLVLRWEFRPGSLLYLVYTRAQAPSLTLPPGQPSRLDLRPVRHAPAADVLLLKLSYWWG